MRKYGLLLGVLLLFAGISLAQDDLWHTNGSLEYNCTTLVAALGVIDDETPIDDLEFGDTPMVRSSDGESDLSLYEYIGTAVMVLLTENSDAEITTADIFAPAILACVEGDEVDSATSSDEDTDDSSTVSGETFNVVVEGNVNLRSCAETTCDIVGQTDDGQILTVVGEDGDWYEVETEDGTAFIASWLTTRGPDDVIPTDEIYEDERTGCRIAFDIKRGDMRLNIILAESGRNDVVVDLYRPNETNPLRVEGQLDKTFIDTGEPYVHQYYDFRVSYPMGVYQLEISYGGETSVLAWELETRGDYNIFVLCE
jgi:hypothetical protein